MNKQHSSFSPLWWTLGFPYFAVGLLLRGTVLYTFYCACVSKLLHDSSHSWDVITCAVLSCSVMSLCDPMNCSLPSFSSLSMEFSRQEYWSELPCPLPGNLPNLGIESRSSKYRSKNPGGFFIIWVTGEAMVTCKKRQSLIPTSWRFWLHWWLRLFCCAAKFPSGVVVPLYHSWYFQTKIFGNWIVLFSPGY